VTQTRTDSIRFLQAGRVRDVTVEDPTLTVLDWLRIDEGLCGTKEGCAEGDCGACTVVIGELDGDGLRYRAVNACIQFLPMLDGKQLITVEDLRPAAGELHPVQQAMVETHGSQCGFCTPGFVMSLFAGYHRPDSAKLRREEINELLAGNLCRCTGYAPIVKAAEASLTGGTDQFDEHVTETIELLKPLQTREMLQSHHDGRRLFQPRSVTQLLEVLETHPQACLVAGATDVGLWVTKQLRQLDTVIDLGRVQQLQQQAVIDGYLHIGSGVTYSDALPILTKYFPDMAAMLGRLGAVQVRNAGTIGGNIANGSPIGDMPPALMVLGTRLRLASVRGEREIDLGAFFIRYGVQDLQTGECVAGIRIPLPAKRLQFRCYKVSKRREQDISALCGAFALQVEDGQVRDIRMAFGGMAETPKRAAACEEALKGKPWNSESIESAIDALDQDFTPITDMRASSEYRTLATRNLLRRFARETGGGTGDGT
jgi:xanthine dehydrogenase small subunit